MHHHSTKQRLAALRRRFGIQLTPPKWAQARSRKFKEAALAAKAETAAAMRAAGDEARRFVASLTPAPGVDRASDSFRQIVEALTPAPSVFFATAGGPEDGDAPTTVAQAPYPSQHLSATDAARARPGGGGDGGSSGGEGGGPGGSKRWVFIVVLILVALGIVAWCGLSKEKPVAEAPPPAPVQASAPAPTPPAPPPPPPPPAPKQLTVVKGDCLWRLSEAQLGDAHAWRRIFEANRGRIRNPDLIYPGQVLELP